MKFKALTLAGIALCYAVPALAHHSFAMFDAEKAIELKGTVKEFQFRNPHSWIHIDVKKEDGTVYNLRGGY